MIFTAADNIISSLGFSASENMVNLEKGITGIRLCNDSRLAPNPFMASLFDKPRLEEEFFAAYGNLSCTLFEKLILLSVNKALNNSKINIRDAKTLFILSSTKGNVELLETREKDLFPENRIFLWETARFIGNTLGNPNPPVIISNACISGVLAINVAADFLRSGKYENVVVSGGDVVNEFVVSGFQSFQSLSPDPCKPFDVNRNGLSLGEGCGTLVLTTNKNLLNGKDVFCIAGEGSSNDANHISGPSRTGDGLFFAVQKAMKQAGVSPESIDFVSAHGTATMYNDEMESKAFTLAGLQQVPLNSIKGYIGHTLGGAGLLETVIAMYCMKNNLLLKTLGYKSHGVPEPINVISQNREKKLSVCLKTASGFGGCNAAVILKKTTL